METNEVGHALRMLAQQWRTPRFDAASLAAESNARRHLSRRRWAASSVAIVLLASSLTAVLRAHSDHRRDHRTPIAGPSHTIISPPCCNLAPGEPPDIDIAPLATVGTLGGQPVLARTQAGRSVTIQARLSFPIPGTRQPVEAAALLVAQPGTSGGTGGTNFDSQYASTKVAEGSPVAATAPETRILEVTTPTDLPPGTYPVFYVIAAGLGSGQRPGIDGAFDMSGQIGVIVLIAP
jgi:hypothetical protein